MQYFTPSCIRFGVELKCIRCDNTHLIKSGTTSNNKQRFLCKKCGKRFIAHYTYQACHKSINQQIIQFIKEGLGIRSMARALKISTTTLIRRIIWIAKNTVTPNIRKHKTYEVDEIRTFIRRKDKIVWIAYAIEKSSRQVVCFSIGARANKTLNIVLETLRLSEAKHIYTDRLINYRYLIRSAFIPIQLLQIYIIIQKIDIAPLILIKQQEMLNYKHRLG